MENKRENKKFYKKIIIVLLSAWLFMLIIPLNTIVYNKDGYNYEPQNYGFKNLAIPDLEGKEYLGDGVYGLYNDDGITIDYNVYNGEYTINGTTTDSLGYAITNYIFEENDYVLTFYGVAGSKAGDGYPSISLYSSTGNPDDSPKIFLPNASSGLITDITNYTVYGGMRRLNFYTNANITYNNYTFKLQIEKGDTASDYEVPIEPLIYHYRNGGIKNA